MASTSGKARSTSSPGRSFQRISAKHDQDLGPARADQRSQSDRCKRLVKQAGEADHGRLVGQNLLGALREIFRNRLMTKLDQCASEVAPGRAASGQIRQQVGDAPLHEAVCLSLARLIVEQRSECKLIQCVAVGDVSIQVGSNVAQKLDVSVEDPRLDAFPRKLRLEYRESQRRLVE